MANSNSQSPVVKFLLIAEIAIAIYLVGKALINAKYDRKDRYSDRPLPGPNPSVCS